MGSIRKFDDNVDPQSFPGAKFVIDGDVPAPQCSEAQVEGDTATTDGPPDNQLTDPGRFAAYDLTGKVCHITASVGGNTGDFNIQDHSSSVLLLDGDPGNGDPVTYHITDGGELILTRDEASFAAYIQAAGYAYTFKGGRLFTDMPSGQLQNACTILFDPIT